MMPSPSSQAPQRFGVLRTIAVFKLAKVVMMLAATYGALRLRDEFFVAKIYSWATTLPSGLEHEWVIKALVWFSGLNPSRIHALGFVTLAYAAVFAVEGVGLWMRRRWAEWMTTVITGSLVPLELWELFHRPTIGKVSLLIVNLVIVGYLIWRIRTDQKVTERYEL